MWEYGTAGNRWPVAPGDIWQAGDHIMACGDLEKGSAQELLTVIGEKPRLTYVDPPWNPGNARTFRTKAGVNDGPVDFPGLLGHVIAAAKSSGLAFVEMGLKYEAILRQVVEELQGIVVAGWDITYYRKFPCRLLMVSWHSGLIPPANSPDGMDDDFTPDWAMTHFTAPGDLVFDPCMGRGLTGRTAFNLKRRFVGSELHPRRMAVFIDWLADQGLSPAKVGELAAMKPGA